MRRRFLPKYVTSFPDRHGKTWYRFRRKGYPSRYFKSAFGTDAFRAEYARFNSKEAIVDAVQQAHAERCVPGSIADLVHRYFATPSRLGPSTATQTKVRRIIERFAEGREDRLIRDVRFYHLDAIIAKAEVKTLDATGRQVGGYEAARKLRKELRRMFEFAKHLEWIEKNPVDGTKQVKVPMDERTNGFYSWTDEDIEQYRDRWSLGTKQRLAMELMLWSDQRKIDAIHLGPENIVGGKIRIRQTKTAKILVLPIVPQLQTAIDAMPNTGSHFLVTEWGKPFSVKGFGNWFRKACDAAGLPQCTAHGLRKATMRRMAELEMPNATMKSVSGHSKDDEVTRYTEAANQKRLADGALMRLSAWESAKSPDSSSDPT